MKRMGQGRRVVVTGIGLLGPTGIGTESAWKSILAGRSGIGPVTLFDATTLPCRIGGELPGFDPLDFVGKKDVKKTSGSFSLPWPPPNSRLEILVSIWIPKHVIASEFL